MSIRTAPARRRTTRWKVSPHRRRCGGRRGGRPVDRATRGARPPGAGEVEMRVGAVAFNHVDGWGWRGMAFAGRKLQLVVGAEAAGEMAAIGPDVGAFTPGEAVVMYGGLACGTCKACREGRDNLCENIAGIMVFHVHGFARDLLNMPSRLVLPDPAGIASHDAACTTIALLSML